MLHDDYVGVTWLAHEVVALIVRVQIPGVVLLFYSCDEESLIKNY